MLWGLFIGQSAIFQNRDWQTASHILTGNAKSIQTFRTVLRMSTTRKITKQG
jgi:hypothetical protein